MTFFVIAQFFLINQYNTRVLRPLFTQLTNEAPHFAPPLQILLQEFLFFHPLYAIFTPIFVNYYEKALKILF